MSKLQVGCHDFRTAKCCAATKWMQMKHLQRDEYAASPSVPDLHCIGICLYIIYWTLSIAVCNVGQDTVGLVAGILSSFCRWAQLGWSCESQRCWEPSENKDAHRYQAASVPGFGNDKFDYLGIKIHFRVHSVLGKSLKMLQFGIKTSRPLKVLENRQGASMYLGVLEKSLNLNLPGCEILHLLTIFNQTLVCMSRQQYLEFEFSLLACLVNHNSHCFHCYSTGEYSTVHCISDCAVILKDCI